MKNTDCTDNGGTLTCMCSNGYSGDGVNSCTSKLTSLVVYKAKKTYAFIIAIYMYVLCRSVDVYI